MFNNKTIVFLFALFTALLLGACSGQDSGVYVPLVFQGEITLADVEAAARPRNDMLLLNLKIEVAGHELARHEPVSGTFLGAYIVRDRTVGGIRDFEAKTGVSHAIFAYTMTLGEDYPLRWVLENMAAAKAPFITLMPWEGLCFGDPNVAEHLKEFAAEAGRFNVPMFVNLFPLVGEHDFAAGEYISFFRASRRLFDHYAPNVALVWGFDGDNLAGSLRFYPGREAVDWIHLLVYNDICTIGEFRDFFAYVDFFYFLYQQERPLAVSTGVSHYSSVGNVYFALEAAARIEYIFGRLRDYPRIKAMIYRNYSDLADSGNKFGIQGINNIGLAYGQATAAAHFLDFVESATEPRQATQVMRSPFRALMVDAYFYVPLRALIYDARMDELYLEKLADSAREIGGEVFLPMIEIHRITGVDFFVDFQRNLMVLR